MAEAVGVPDEYRTTPHWLKPMRSLLYQEGNPSVHFFHVARAGG
jgi:hypothetical protein